MSDFETLVGLGVPVQQSKDRAADALEKLGTTVAKLRAAAKATEPEPTEEQKESGRYKKGRVSWKGLTLAIETAAGNRRSPEWPPLKDHYGYVEGTESGADGDAVDVFVSEANPDSEIVFVVNQKKPDGTFDEHKCILGCVSTAEAKKTYLRNYSPGWTGMGEVASLTLPQFKWWLENADTSKEVKKGYFAAVENRKPMKKAAADPATGESDFWARNEARKAEAQANPKSMPHVRDGYIPCPGCHYRYHVMPDDSICPKCSTKMPTRLRGLSKKAFEEYVPQLTLVKRGADEGDHPFTIAVDFDGTLAEAQVPFDPETCGKPRKRALHWVRLFHENGARIIIFTVRGNTKPVEAWLKKHDVPYDFINENPDQPPGSSGKVFADAYWDDRAYNAVDPDEHGPLILDRLLGQDEADDASDPSPVITIRRETVVTISGPSLLAAMEGTDDDEGPGAD